jgi:hypothetical protein
MLTFEFPTPEKAKEFSDRMIVDGFGNPKRSHRVVDVDEGDGSDPWAHDYVMLLAACHGASEAQASIRAARDGGDRLYTLHTWNRDDEPSHTEVNVTTLAAFLADNPNLALAVVQTIEHDGTFTGGGGSQPSWRITRTPFVGTRREP